MITVIILVILILLYVVNRYPIGYRPSNNQITPNYAKVFSPKCLPIEFVNGSEEAVLCIHGFPATPHSFAYTAEKLHAEGYDVYVPLLPGFGTSIDEFIETNFVQWYQWLSEYYKEICSQYKRVSIVGCSMGGALALKLAEEFSQDPHYNPNCVITIGAPVFLHRPTAGVFRWEFLIIRTAGWITPTIKARLADGDHHRSPGSDGELNWVGYRGVYPKQGYSLLMGLREIKKNLSHITSPLLVLHSPRDKTVPYQNMKYIAKHVPNSKVSTKSYPMEGQTHTCHTLMSYFSSQDEVVHDIIHHIASRRVKDGKA